MTRGFHGVRGRCRPAVVGTAILLVLLGACLVDPLLLKGTLTEVDVNTGRLRDTAVLFGVKVGQSRIRGTPLSRAASPPEEVTTQSGDWRLAGRFGIVFPHGVFGDYYETPPYHGVWGDACMLEAYWEQSRCAPGMRRKVAREYLRRLQAGGNCSAAREYVCNVLRGFSAPCMPAADRPGSQSDNGE